MHCATPHEIINQFFSFVNGKSFPCAAARAAFATGTMRCMVAEHMACPKDDAAILQFIYDFTNDFRLSGNLFHTAVVIFREPALITSEIFEVLLWKRLQALSDADQKNYCYDPRVSADPSSPGFSFSLKEEAFFVIGMNPQSERKARAFLYPAIIFNPHVQFEMLKDKNRYEKLKSVIRTRDIAYSGSVNPMLDDYGKSSEARQYSGRKYDNKWQCPLNRTNGKSVNHTAP